MFILIRRRTNYGIVPKIKKPPAGTEPRKGLFHSDTIIIPAYSYMSRVRLGIDGGDGKWVWYSRHSNILPPSHEATDGQGKNVRMFFGVRVVG